MVQLFKSKWVIYLQFFSGDTCQILLEEQMVLFRIHSEDNDATIFVRYNFLFLNDDLLIFKHVD